MTPSKRTFLPAFAAIFISIVIWLVIYPPEASRVFLNHRRAVQSVRSIGLAERDYAAHQTDAAYDCNLGDLGQHGLGDKVLASGTKAGYRFEIHCPNERSQMVYSITAVPVSPGTSGKYALCTDQSGQIWYSEKGLISDCFAMHKPIDRKYE